MKSIPVRVNYLLVIGLFLTSTCAYAAPYDLVKTYFGTNKSWLYGWSMSSIGTNKILVGSLQDTTAGPAAGAAYVMDATTGGILLTIPNPTPVEFDNFGQAVVSVGNNLLVGANRDGHTSAPNPASRGAAYLIDGTSGSLLRTFQAPTSNGFSYGSAVATVGPNILIGEEDAALGGNVTAYLYNSDSGSLVRTISNVGLRSQITSSNSYLSVAGTQALIGAPGSNGSQGIASLYETTNGNLLRTFTNPFVTTQDNFGFAVASLPGNRFAISAPWADRGATNSGAVYVFDGATGALLQTFLDPNASADGNFGRSIAAVGDNVLIGAPFDDFGAMNDGLAYLFSASTGALLHTFHNPTPQDQDWFGKYVTALGNDFLISAAEDNTMASQAGAVYRFAGVPEPSSFALASVSLFILSGCARRRRNLRA